MAAVRHVEPCGMFSPLPGQFGDNKRLRKPTSTMPWLVSALGQQATIAAHDV
jgi:hypothetical protein